MGLKRQKLKDLENLKLRSKLYDVQMQQTVGGMMEKKKQLNRKQIWTIIIRTDVQWGGGQLKVMRQRQVRKGRMEWSKER